MTEHRYLATFTSPCHFVRPENCEVIATSPEAALEKAKRNHFHATCKRDVHIWGPLHPSADHEGSTHGD